MRARILVCIALLAAPLAACQSSSNPSCGYNGATQLAPSTWPKFRADGANTGRADVDLSSSNGVPAVLLQGYCGSGTNINLACQSDSDCAQPTATPSTPISATPTPATPVTGSPTSTSIPTATPLGCVAIGAVVASPVLFDTTVYAGSTDGTLYGVTPTGNGSINLSRFGISGPISGTPLVGANGNLFVPGNGVLIQFFPDGGINHQTSLSGVVSGSPNIWSSNGTAYIGTEGGEFTGICPNGIARYAVGFPSTQSSAAVVQDPHLQPGDLRPIAVGGGTNGQVRAYDIKGRQYYMFTATNTIIASVVVDDSADPRVFYVADTNGALFVVNLTSGQSANLAPTPTSGPIFRAPSYCSVTRTITCSSDTNCPRPETCVRTRIIASPALGSDDNNRIYVADNIGVLWALERGTGTVIWQYPPGMPPPAGRHITSSPAVATGGSQDVVVFAVDFFDADVNRTRSRMVALVDTGAAPMPLPSWHSADGLEGVPICGTVGTSANSLASSPSIGPDGTVYIGVAIVGDDAAPECVGITPLETRSGGALAAIMP